MGKTQVAGDEEPLAGAASEEDEADGETRDESRVSGEATDTEREEGAEAGEEGKEEEGEAEGRKTGKVEIPPEVQEVIDARIGKEVGRRRAAEERLAEVQREVEGLRGQADKTDGKTVTSVLGHPVYGLDETQLGEQERYWQEVEDWCRAHAGRDYAGSEGDPKDPPQSAEVIGDRLVEAGRVLRTIERARSVARRRTDLETTARGKYPELFRAGSDAQVETRKIIRAYPELVAVPGWQGLVGEILAARKAGPGAGKAGAGAPPRVPTGSSTANRGVTNKGKKPSSFDIFARGGFTQDALAEALE